MSNILFQVFLRMRLSQRILVCDSHIKMVKAQDRSLIYSFRFDKINYNILLLNYLYRGRESEQEYKSSGSKAELLKLD